MAENLSSMSNEEILSMIQGKPAQLTPEQEIMQQQQQFQSSMLPTTDVSQMTNEAILQSIMQSQEAPPEPVQQVQPQVEEKPLTGYERFAGGREGEMKEFMSTPGLQAAYQEQPPEKPLTGYERSLDIGEGLPATQLKANMDVAVGMMMSSNPEAQKDIVKKYFPDSDIIETKDKQGNDITVIELPDGRRTILNKPDMSYQDTYSFLGDMALFYGPSKVGSIGKGLLAKAGIIGVTEGATEAARQKSLQAIGSEQDVSAGDVALATGTGVASELAAPIVKGLAKKIPMGKKAQAKALGVAEEQVEQATRGSKVAEEAAKEMDVDLIKAQKTGLFSDTAETAYVASLPESAQKGMDFFKKQNKQVYNAMLKFVNKIAPKEAVGKAGAKIRSTAQKAIEAKKSIRRQATSKLYNEAIKGDKKFNFKDTVDLVENEITDAVGKYETGLKKVKRMIDGDITLKKAHNAKMALDDMIAESSRKGNDNLSRELLGVKEKFLGEIEGFSPTYKKARLEYSKLSPAVKDLEDSILGKIAKYDDTQIGNVAKQIFNPDQGVTNPKVIQEARKTIESVDPQAWKDIVRTELERRMLNIKFDSSLELADNVPAQIYSKLFGSPKQRKILEQALTPEQKKRFTFLRIVTQRASKARPGGSMTAFNKQVEKRLEKGVLSKITALTAPGETVRGVAADKIRAKNLNVISDILLNPKWSPDFEKLRRMDLESPEAGRLFERIYKSAAKAIKKDKGKTAKQIATLAKPAAQALKPDTE
jgi:hypothetical protein